MPLSTASPDSAIMCACKKTYIEGYEFHLTIAGSSVLRQKYYSFLMLVDKCLFIGCL